MMGGVSPETCWTIKKQWNNKFYYTVASFWFFLWDLYYDTRNHEHNKVFLRTEYNRYKSVLDMDVSGPRLRHVIWIWIICYHEDNDCDDDTMTVIMKTMKWQAWQSATRVTQTNGRTDEAFHSLEPPRKADGRSDKSRRKFCPDIIGAFL